MLDSVATANTAWRHLSMRPGSVGRNAFLAFRLQWVRLCLEKHTTRTEPDVI